LRQVYQLLHNLCLGEIILKLVKRLVYEMRIGQRFLAGPLSLTVKAVEVVNILRFDKNDISVICKVEFKNPRSKSNLLFEDSVAETQLLERDGKGVCTFFVRRKLPDPPKGLNPRLVYLSTPWRIENEIGRATFLGSAKQIKRMMAELQNAGIVYKIISLTDARFSQSSLMNVLTGKQREVLSTAFQEGYYDIPRKMRSDKLAEKLGMRNATFVAHRRKAERRLVAEILSAI
jgi:TfoX/Sxy family transcriptional regulator of competence genes